jgi:aminopeptidase N
MSGRHLFPKTLTGLWLVAVSVIFPAHSEEPFSFARTPGQLPKNVVPSHYAIRIEPDLEARSFRGEETIALTVRETVRELTLNSLGLEIESATLLGATETPLTPRLDEKRQTLKLTLPHPLVGGDYEIKLAFRGKLSERPNGLYITRYQSGSESGHALVTQMEATDARRMFPCWDEPVYRATFQLTAVIPAKDSALSNMPIEREHPVDGGKKELAFARTPSMPSYLIAFAAGEFDVIEDKVDGVQLRVFTTKGKREQARYAMEATKKILPFYNEYFGTKYPLPKLDQIAFPSTAASGMENWGAIVYNDLALLYDPAQSSIDTKQRVFGVVAHEIAHQWFGDLVTMAWWDNLWLNEGFASWMGTKATDKFNPDWKAWLRAANRKEWAMRLDARATTHPIQQPIANEGEANDAFDKITYSKGQSFLRMLESWLGETTFRDGIRDYMAKHAYGNTTTADLWNALERASGQPVREVASGWTEQPGFPMVLARRGANGGGLSLQQERFTVHQRNPKKLFWKIPVVLGPADSDEGTVESRVALLGEKSLSLEAARDAAPLKINRGDVGYYRVDYETKWRVALDMIAVKMPEADRLNFVNDRWAMVQAGRAPVVDYLNLVARLADDTSPVVIQQFAETIAFIDHLRRPHGDQGDDNFTRWAIALLRRQLERIGLAPKRAESPLDTQTRSALITTLGKLGEARVRDFAFARFREFQKDQTSLDGDLRDPVLSIVGRYGTAEDYAKLHELAREADSFELKRTCYYAMAETRDAALATKTLALALTDELVPAEATRLVQRVASGDNYPDLAWAFVKKHADALHAKLSSLNVNQYVPDLFQVFHEPARADELEKFARAKLPPDSAKKVAEAVDEIRFKAELKAKILPAIEKWSASHQPVENQATR